VPDIGTEHDASAQSFPTRQHPIRTVKVP